MDSAEFNALTRGLRSIAPGNPWLQRTGARDGCIRNPRTTGRSGCTPAEPYPPSRNPTLTRKEKFANALTNHIPVNPCAPWLLNPLLIQFVRPNRNDDCSHPEGFRHKKAAPIGAASRIFRSSLTFSFSLSRLWLLWLP